MIGRIDTSFPLLLVLASAFAYTSRNRVKHSTFHYPLPTTMLARKRCPKNIIIVMLQRKPMFLDSNMTTLSL